MTTNVRETIVRAVEADIEYVDYQAQEVELLAKAAVRAMPESVKLIYLDKDCKPYITNSQVSVSSLCKQGYSTLAYVPGCKNTVKLTDAEKKSRELMIEKSKVQSAKIKAVMRELKKALAQFNTVAQMKKAMPEFAKYLPTEESRTQNLPAVTGVVESLRTIGIKLP
jgi:hypothetical protein